MKRKVIKCLVLIIVFAFQINVIAQTDLTPDIKAAVLIEASSGKVLYEKNPNEPLPPASVTKIMTMLLTMEAIARGELTYDAVVTASERAKSMGGSTIFLDTNEQMSVNDLLKGIAVASGNDACVAIAEHLSGSVEAFVEKMNARAKELGMNNTHFVNCNGLDAEGHLTSAYDIALMSRELLKHNDIFNYTTIWMDSLRNGAFQLANTNKLIRFYNGANGLKTGSTSIAGNCISATAKRDGMQLIAVVLGAPTSKQRFASASKLLDYGFANYAVTEFGEKGSKIRAVSVKRGKEGSVLAIAGGDSAALIEKAQQKNAKMHINLPDELQAPVKKGDVIGEMIITLNGETLAKTEIIAASSVEKRGYFDYFYQMCKGLLMINNY